MSLYSYHIYLKKNTENETNLYPLLDNPKVDRLLAFIETGQTFGVTLKEIKKQLQPFNEYEKLLDDLIQWQLIQRNDRRYIISFPVIAEQDYQLISQFIKPQARKLLEYLMNKEQEIKEKLAHFTNKDVTTLDYFLLIQGKTFQELIASQINRFDEKSIYLTGKNLTYNLIAYDRTKEFGKDLGSSYSRFKETSQNSYQFMSFSNWQSPLADVSSYLAILQNPKSLKEKLFLTEVYELIGDVRPAYFIESCGNCLRRVNRKGFLIEKEPNIFSEALIKLNYLEKKEGAITNLVPIYTHYADFSEEIIDYISKLIECFLEEFKMQLEQVGKKLSGISFCVYPELYYLEIYQLLAAEVTNLWCINNQFIPSKSTNCFIFV